MSIRRETTDVLLITALLGGASQAEAARRAGVTERTVYRRVHDKEFLDRLRAARQAVLERAGGRSAALALKALDTIEAVMDEGEDPLRLRAAQLALGAPAQLGSLDDLAARIDVLEQRLKDGGGA